MDSLDVFSVVDLHVVCQERTGISDVLCSFWGKDKTVKKKKRKQHGTSPFSLNLYEQQPQLFGMTVH